MPPFPLFSFRPFSSITFPLPSALLVYLSIYICLSLSPFLLYCFLLEFLSASLITLFVFVFFFSFYALSAFSPSFSFPSFLISLLSFTHSLHPLSSSLSLLAFFLSFFLLPSFSHSCTIFSSLSFLFSAASPPSFFFFFLRQSITKTFSETSSFYSIQFNSLSLNSHFLPLLSDSVVFFSIQPSITKPFPDTFPRFFSP